MAIKPHEKLGVIRRRVKVTRDGNRTRIPVEPPATGFTTVEAPNTEHTVEIEIDLDWLVKQLAAKAIDSKGGQARESSGSVVVKRVK